MDRGDFHLVIDGAGLNIQSPAEDVGKPQDIVDLIGVVGTPGGDNGVRARGLGLFRLDFRVGVGHGEDDGFCGHGFYHFRRQGTLHRKAQENVGAFYGLGQSARIRIHGMGRFPLVYAFFAALVNHTFAIAEHGVVMGQPQGFDEFDTGDSC
jgi:hypothetical protein